ncbi:unnamed protein product [Phyllotreta striolata]|uniref:Alpha-tubulin N-acetyltransferase n=1 Tax=Phyllotreta striolata TaxID=444603 RepID=A0A9N9XQ10_PHYSR|nr:unnamed protein product [Phyllotreta striolata]
MEFRFNVNEVLKTPLVKIGNSLIPSDYAGPRRMLYDTISKVGEIVNEMGSASAKSQGLLRPLTTTDKLKNSQHDLYLAVDQTANYGRGAVAGMLKTGKKSLYVLDRLGREYQVKAPFLFDFYVPENKQRMGWGKFLYDSLLWQNDLEPAKIAYDQPTDALSNFLSKHYGLSDAVKQPTRFVVYDGFFSNEEGQPMETTKSEIVEDDFEEDKIPLGRSRRNPKYELVIPDEDEEEMYRPKNLLE